MYIFMCRSEYLYIYVYVYIVQCLLHAVRLLLRTGLLMFPGIGGVTPTFDLMDPAVPSPRQTVAPKRSNSSCTPAA